MFRRMAFLVVAVAVLSASAGAGLLDAWFVRGDANRDGTVDISDSLSMLGYLFGGDARVSDTTCLAASDANGDGNVDISDPVYTLSFLFLGGPVPPAPYPHAGPDQAPGGLGCLR